jgi:hypothetical protein
MPRAASTTSTPESPPCGLVTRNLITKAHVCHSGVWHHEVVMTVLDRATCYGDVAPLDVTVVPSAPIGSDAWAFESSVVVAVKLESLHLAVREPYQLQARRSRPARFSVHRQSRSTAGRAAVLRRPRSTRLLWRDFATISLVPGLGDQGSKLLIQVFAGKAQTQPSCSPPAPASANRWNSSCVERTITSCQSISKRYSAPMRLQVSPQALNALLCVRGTHESLNA